MKQHTEQSLVKRVQHLGSDARDVRDAAHEACHALNACVADGQWDRETIHQHVLEECPSASEQVGAEIFARAVEWRVCDFFSVEYDLQHWAGIAFMETLKNMNLNTPIDFWPSAIDTLYDHIRTITMADRILSL